MKDPNNPRRMSEFTPTPTPEGKAARAAQLHDEIEALDAAARRRREAEFPGIRYFVEALPGGRGQMHADVLDADGNVAMTYPVGSPAPYATVQEAARRDNR
jgi:hypothetical protein